MLWETHSIEFKQLIRQTHNFKTSKAAHRRLEQIVIEKCENIKNIDYGLQVMPETVLRIAKSDSQGDNLLWLLQPELKAINDGLKFVEREEDYTGYINAEGQYQGVGIIHYFGQI